ncbi:MAG: hypothetical protein QMB90_04200, partial [Rubritalea sp.]
WENHNTITVLKARRKQLSHKNKDKNKETDNCCKKQQFFYERSAFINGKTLDEAVSLMLPHQ